MKNFGFLVLFMLIAGGNGFSQEQWTKYTVENGLPTNHVNSLALSPDGKLLIGLADLKGVWSFNDGKFSQVYSTEDGLLSNEIQSIKIQDNKKIWISTWIGLSQFDGIKWTSYDDTNGLKYKNIIDFCFVPNGKVWCATYKEIGNTPYCAISCFNGSEWSSYSTEDSLRGNYNRLTSIAVDKNGIVWMGTGYGLLSFDGNNWKRYTTEDGLNNDNIYNLTTSPDGTLYIAAGRGFNIFKDSTFDFINFPMGFASINSIYFLSNDNFWIGYPDGIAEFKNEKWSVYDYTNQIEYFGENSSICVDSSGIVWAGLYQGLISFNPNYTFVNSDKFLNFKIMGAYPNPFNPMTTINYSIASQGHITLAIYNISGQKVATLVNGEMTPGKHAAKFNGASLASGVYFFRFEAGKFAKTGKMLLVK